MESSLAFNDWKIDDGDRKHQVFHRPACVWKNNEQDLSSYSFGPCGRNEMFVS